jgi:hypothetical protein
MRLNHVANRLDPRYFETVVEMLKTKLGFVELRRTERAIWLRQPKANVDLQFSRSDTANRDADKLRFQVFIPERDPQSRTGRLAGVGAGAWDGGVGRQLFRQGVLPRRSRDLRGLRHRGHGPGPRQLWGGGVVLNAVRQHRDIAVKTVQIHPDLMPELST